VTHSPDFSKGARVTNINALISEAEDSTSALRHLLARMTRPTPPVCASLASALVSLVDVLQRVGAAGAAADAANCAALGLVLMEAQESIQQVARQFPQFEAAFENSKSRTINRSSRGGLRT
jgi:hypothetical protein